MEKGYVQSRRSNGGRNERGPWWRELAMFEPDADRDVEAATVTRGATTCSLTGFTTPVERVREQLRPRRGGADDARLMAVITSNSNTLGRRVRLPTHANLQAAQAAARRAHQLTIQPDELFAIPDEQISRDELRRISVPIYGMGSWADLFAPRQRPTLSVLIK